MSTAVDAKDTRPSSRIPGAQIIRRVRRLLLAAAGSALGYATLIGGSKGGCAGGVTATGFLDADGNATDAAPTCVQMALGPNPLMFAVFAVIVFWALGHILSRADGEAAAIRTLDRAALGVMITAASSVVIAQVWFGMFPLWGIDGAGTYIWPFPFGAVDFQVSTMDAP